MMADPSKLRLTVPERFSDNFGEPVIHFLKILPLLNEEWSEIEVDFGNNKFLVPHYLGPLSCILRQKAQQGIKISILNANENSYLSTVKFPLGMDFETLNHEDISLYFNQYETKRYLPIIHFPTGTLFKEAEIRNKLLSAINALLKQQLKLPINILQAFYYFLDELTQNIVDHSGVFYGTIFAQFYPDKRFLDLSICDSGNGIFKNYLLSKKHEPKTNAEALNYAVYGRSTKDIPESRGFGLNTSRTMLVKGMQGKFFLMSGNDFFVQTVIKEEIITLNEKTYYSGCMLNLRIPIFESETFSIHSYTDL
jgi:hypothetical protein